MRSTTIKELRDWELGGAIWRALELSDQHAVIELCSCSGEPMDHVESDDREVIDYVRTHESD